MTVSTTLRPRPASFAYNLSLIHPSHALLPSDVPSSSLPRPFYLGKKPTTHEPGPILAVFPFVPLELAEHLMTHKRDSALGSKFIENRESCTITNMEGALHTFVTAVLPIKLHGDPAYRSGHTVLEFPKVGGKKHYRPVLLSTQIHLDFELRDVGGVLYSLEDAEVLGEALEDSFEVLEAAKKHNPVDRRVYDTKLRRHAILHLTKSGRLPRARATTPITSPDAIDMLEADLRSPTFTPNLLCGEFVITSTGVLSLEMMEESYVASLVNELSVLGIACPNGYIYLYNPPSIFARHLPATLTTRLMASALRRIAADNALPGLRIFAIDAFADPGSVKQLQRALQNRPHVKVLSRAELFSDGGHLRCDVGLTLVLHNNSDAFGQNILTEGCSSLDGVIGVHSSAAAGLGRDRPDLMAHVV